MPHWLTPSLFLAVILILFPINSLGMDFRWETRDKVEHLVLFGEIKAGDSERFRSFLRKNFQRYKNTRWIRLASNGGDVVEALKVSAILRSIYPIITVEGDKCASSCFYLFLSGVHRSAKDPIMVGIHRAYFAPVHFEKLSPLDARSRQMELTKLLDAVLDENQVPQYLKETLNRTASADVYWLTTEDLEKIGRRPAWYEELLIAKCGYGKVIQGGKKPPEQLVSKYEALDAYLDSYICEQKLIDAELRVMPAILTPQSETIRKTAAGR